MKHSDDARQAIHDWRWGPYIDDPIERQEVADAMIATIMNAFNQLEAENARLKDELSRDRLYTEFVMEKDYGGEFDEWIALLTEQEQADG